MVLASLVGLLLQACCLLRADVLDARRESPAQGWLWLGLWSDGLLSAVVPLRDHSVVHADGVVRVLLLP